MQNVTSNGADLPAITLSISIVSKPKFDGLPFARSCERVIAGRPVVWGCEV